MTLIAYYLILAFLLLINFLEHELIIDTYSYAAIISLQFKLNNLRQLIYTI